MNTKTSPFDVHALDGVRIAVLGYGSQGRAHALNLRDSGLDVVVGLRPGGRTWARAQDDGFSPVPVGDALGSAGLVSVLVPDMAQPGLFAEHLGGRLRPGTMVLFAHGFCVHFGQVELPAEVDVGLVAPKGPGDLVRRQYERGQGVPALVAVGQDATTRARDKVLAYAQGIGATRAGIIETTFAEETETDLFGEQAVLCGGATELVTAGFDTLVEAGYRPEVAYFECVHELKLIVDLLYEGGLAKLHEFVSETAIFGDLTRGARVVDAQTRARMRGILEEIQSGQFAREWVLENQAGRPAYRRLLARDLEHPIETVGRRLREQMSWLEAGRT